MKKTSVQIQEDFVKDNDVPEDILMPNLECKSENMPTVFVRLIELVNLSWLLYSS